ncbi:cadherin-related tumor suppressor [Anopheles cruzii]|uniref:cadherin-related tumor suppressor n=1 Tax=Anopheles cruzii TaxID=68878 RepID=UPI0022EC8595|nr:cadherin-related tumor suppressor [Anopheles cruzii]
MRCVSVETNLRCWLLLVLVTVAASGIEQIGAHSPGPGPGPGFGGPAGVVMIARRRSSSGDGAMQSRAVETRVQFNVFENEPKGTVVGYIPTKPGFTYRFNEPPREFVLDASTGEIRTNAILDREATRNDRYDLVILSSQPTYPIEVRITVIDVNDNAPEFPEPTIAVSFSESAITGTRLLLDAATDRDTGENDVTDDYQIVGGNHDDKFRLAVTTSPNGDVYYLHLETTGKLDRETRGFYALNISAKDGGEPSRYGYLQVNVTILDVNDNPPIFDHSDYIVSLNESVLPGTPVLQVMASDNDLGDNSKITYYLADSQTQFTVDPETGVIATTEQLTCPHQNCQSLSRPDGTCPKSCVFTVFARDHGTPRQDGRTYVTVNLVDTNDHDPVIRFQYFPPTGSFATVDENAANSSVVAAVSVVDMDEGANGDTSLKIIAGNDLQHFRLEKSPSFYIVRVNGVLDREEIGKYNLTVVAIDRGTPPRSATAHLIIHVNDVNDHEPVFEKSEYSAVLSELAPVGTYVASITASDEDTGVNAQIFYDFVSGNQEQWFRIDPTSGLITTQAALDREVHGHIELSISARDGGPNPKWAHTQLKVTILDENDEAPRFVQPQINVTLNESAKAGTVVVSLTAIDHDQGTNGSITYALHASVEKSYPGTFTIDPVSGQISTRVALDRERVASYDVQVVARDHGSPPQSSTAIVHLTVEDANDNSPELYPRHYFVPIADSTPVGSVIARVTATDRDEGDNARVTYDILAGTDPDGLVAIDAATGTITLRGSLQKSPKPIHKITIGCMDRGGRRAERTALVEIIKESIVEEIAFDAPGYEFRLLEDNGFERRQTNREVGHVRTKGGGAGRTVEYSIVRGDPTDAFRIHERTGVLSTARHIDREQRAAYSLVVAGRNGFAYGEVVANVTIGDLNDNAPVFLYDHDEIALLENTAVGQEIYVARAKDADTGPNSNVVFGLATNPEGLFRISESTGVLYLNRSIFVDPGTVLSLEVSARDGGKPPLTTRSTVQIVVEDVNDHTPVFDHTSYETSLLESMPVNFRFFALAASDADTGANGRITYAIVEGNVDGKFGIFPDGYLFVRSALDREERDYYSLTVSCADEGQPVPRSSSVPVIVHVIDENDNAPQFTNSTFVFSVAENEPPETFVGKLTAHDRDIGRNAELIYTLVYGGGGSPGGVKAQDHEDFSIDSRNGFIRTRRPFDREALVQATGQDFLTLEATVSDNGMVRLRDRVKIKVTITDVNDNAPHFIRAPYRVQISEGSTIGTQLVRVYTNDADVGLNGDVFYYIQDGNQDERFSIDDSTGQIMLTQALDRETTPFYRLTVVAHDASMQNRLSASTTVTIEVLDENDDAPEFTQTLSRIAIIETTPVGTELIRFRATDNDLGANAQITFSIAAGNRRDTFAIDPLSGFLYLHKLLDYEDTQSYSLNISAADGGNPRLATTILFVVNVIDSNDNPPSFPNTAIVRQIREGIPLHTPIVTVSAEDPDSGDNGKVTYEIAHQDPDNRVRHFGINPTTGVIHTLHAIDREAIDTYRLTVLATDQHPVPAQRLSAEKLVTVIVEDVNDNAPVFVSMNAAILSLKDVRLGISESGPAATIMHVNAEDADSSSNGLVTYEMIGGNTGLFQLHRTTGAITLRRPIAKPDIRYQLSVRATDEAVQSERKSSDAYLTILTTSAVVGAPGNGPAFAKKDLSGSVSENEPIGTSILTVSAYLNSVSDIEYYVTNVTGGGRQVNRLFDIDTKLGILSTAAELDRESGIEHYDVEVYAIAIGGVPRTTSTRIRVNVLDKNDSPPKFHNLPMVFSVSEDLAIGQTVARITATDPDTIGKLEYTLLKGDTAKFALERETGLLKLRDTLDRETVSSYRLTVSVTDGIQSTETTITVQVTDTNDNPPVFAEPAYSFDIPENAQRGYHVGVIQATDPDIGTNAAVTYTVISDWANDVFSLNPQTGIFTLTARLDFEEVQHYILVVQAQDNGYPSLSSTLTVYCNVVDLNDNAPIFDPMSYSNEIFENAPINSDVVTVSATDIDSGPNGRIEYSISAGDEQEDFQIMANGTIRTRRSLDRETKSVYNLVITAQDCAQEPEKRLSSTVQVSILLKDINDLAPEFVSPNETSVAENIPINTVIMAIKAVDRDEGRNGYVEYQLDDHKPDSPGSSASSGPGPFTVGQADGLLRVSGPLDREVKSSYELRVIAKDRGDPSRSTPARIRINVLDENDNSPIFDPKQYSAAIAENASIGASVLQVSATDIDEGANGRVRFSIAAGDDNRDFSISEDSGVVRVAKNLNFERKALYTITVRAEDCAGDIDGGAEVRFDTARLSITITDINDNPPTFLDSPYLAYIMENVIPPNGGYVITVRAYDADTPPFNSQVRYFLKEGDTDYFKINASTGEISLLRALDRELQAEYILTLVAMDTGSPPLTGTGTVRVIVQDINDHSPEFERQSYAATVAENQPIGTKVLWPRATDKDAGPNARIVYTLLGEHSDRFRLDAGSGEIATGALLDREDVPVYHFTLMAQDSSSTEPRASVVNLTIAVQDVNDNSPSFSAPSFAVTIPDRIKPGQFVFGANAIDRDEGANSRILYAIVAGPDAGRFRVNEHTGVIEAAVELSSPSAVGGPNAADLVYRLTIVAKDHGAEPRSASCELVISLKSAHLFPVFSYPSETQFVLPEDIADGKMVTRLAATSPKKGALGNIRYAIAGGNIGDALRIDPNTGEVAVNRGGLDYERNRQYEVWIEAADSDRPSLRSVLQLTVNVTDANDNAPLMDRQVYVAEVMEEEPPSQLIAKVSATDADSEENGQITYHLRADYEAFEINTDTGEIFTTMRLDREDTAHYTLIVDAVDQGVPQLTGSAAVLVNVLDKNDNPPKFTRLFSVNVTENAEIGQFVIKITSSDSDVGVNANASYIFTENIGHKFSIDSTTGNVTVAGHLDRELQDEYILKVAAVDGAWRTETPLTITIQDQNDNAPEFEHSYYSFNFPELQKPIMFVGQVIATDRDKQGPNSVISYSLQQPSDLFSIDPATGELFSKRKIHYKHTQIEPSPENMFSLTVLATDNGKPPMYTECLVNVNIVDANNNPPVFGQPSYMAPAPEGATAGQRIVQLAAKDDLDYGVNAEIEYAVTGGNGSARFAINKLDGWIIVSGGASLSDPPGTVYSLTVRAIDRGVPPQQDEVAVTIIVTGVNKFSPVFQSPSYQVIVPENEPVGSTILTVSAPDNDDGPNGMVRYSILAGNERNDFSVHAVSGAVVIRQPLDYDLVQVYQLNITAEDLGYRSRRSVAMITITLTDINDNAPYFNQSVYGAYVAENSPPNSFVYRAVAHDRDSPKNAVIVYAIVGGTGRDLFAIEPGTGVITSTATFDYEEQDRYVLRVVGSNPDSAMRNETKIVVHVTGVNEYYPKFVQPVFHFDVSESAEVGSSVGIIQATDKDAGEDGKVYYLLVGSSNDKGFSIHPESGVIVVSRNLDRETQSRVVLTVLAKNYGGIRGNDTDEAQVIISIQDGNDPPEFLLDLYETTISEGDPLGTKVPVAVKAVDKDVRPQNNQFSYSIIGGNNDHSFKIDPQSGQIETTRLLDRESVPVHKLIVGAIDGGVPPQTGTTVVQITLSDINDNGPVFDAKDTVGTVLENEPPNTVVMTLAATDPDLPPNGGPFTYYLVGGRHKSFFTLEKHSGVLRTVRSIDRETTAQLELLVEVEDNGSPRMRTQQTITVNVIDQNDSPSTPRIVHVLVYVFNGVVHGDVANVHPNDADLTGDYRCKLLSDLNKQPVTAFFISSGCLLRPTELPQGGHTGFLVSGNDGKHPDVISTVSVEFLHFDNATVENSITVRLANVSSGTFLANYYRNFMDIAKGAVEGADELILYSLRDVEKSLHLTVAIRSGVATKGYRSAKYVIERLSRKLEAINQLLPAASATRSSTALIGYAPCLASTCDNGGVCSAHIQVHDQNSITDSQSLIFTSPLVRHDFACRCPEGFTGPRCERRQDPCSPNPCHAGGQCRRQGYDFQCSCPPNREGKYCQLERGDICSSGPCQNGGSCRESSDGSSFFCLCRPGYRGNQCEAVADSCRPNPCLYGGLCVSLKPGYRCSCVDGRYGRYCEKTTFGFRELSYMAFPALDSATNDISVIFATTKPDALLVYNYGIQSGGRSDFVAMEVVNGRAVFSFGGARTAITSLVVGQPAAGDSGSISNGEWHKITATRNGRVMSLSVSKCTENGDFCDDCRPGDSACYADDTGPTGTLNFNKHYLLVGGLIAADPVLERPGQVHSDDLVGCVHSVSINGRALNLSNPIKSFGIERTCQRRTNGPGGGPCSLGLPDDPAQPLCGPFGQCMDRWNTALCRCGGSILSPDCYGSLEPYSLQEGAFIEYEISEKHKRMQLLENLYSGRGNIWSYDVARNKRYGEPAAGSARTENMSTLTIGEDPPKYMSILFKTNKETGLLIYAATNKHFTSLELKGGRLYYTSHQTSYVNVSSGAPGAGASSDATPGGSLADGRWHNVTIHSHNRILQVLVDGRNVVSDLDATGVHDFLDPYLTVLSIGSVRREHFVNEVMPAGFQGCLANFTINGEVQPFNGSGSIFRHVVHRGAVLQGCAWDVLGTAQVTNPLNIGITLVIVFFVMLLVGIFISFLVVRCRKQHKEKSGALVGHSGATGPGGLHSAKQHNGGSTMLGPGGLGSGGGVGGPGGGGLHGDGNGRGLHVGDLSLGVGYHSENGADMLRGVGGHHLVGPELISKKYKERDLGSGEPQRPQRPDIIEREVVSKSPPLREDHHPPLPPPSHGHDHTNPSMDLGSEYPEHYDLENASSIAPSDIDIVYHYKGYREAGGVRKYKATPPPVATYNTHHKHQTSAAQQQQHRHSPHHAVTGGGPYGPHRGVPPQASQPPPSNPAPRQHQSTPLARLSPSSELSSQQPRILTLHDISGKPLQSALLATTSSSGGVGKDALHSNSERSLNSPVMSQLSGQSSSASRKNPGGGGGVGGGPCPSGQPGPNGVVVVSSGVVVVPSVVGGGPMGLTAEEIERLNARPRTSSLVSTLDAVSSSSEAPRGPAPHLTHMHHSPAVDAHSSTSTDESGNDSFTCSEIEYDNNSLGGGVGGGGGQDTGASAGNSHHNNNNNGSSSSKYGKGLRDRDRDRDDPVSGGKSTAGGGVPGGKGGPPHLPPPASSYDGFDSSFRGSLSTLVASDDDLSSHMVGMYRGGPTGGGGVGGTTSPQSATGWDYLLNWGPNFESLMGVFKDIAELPDTVVNHGRVPSALRIPTGVQKPSEEYV